VIDPLANDQKTSDDLDPRSVSLIAPANATDIQRDSDGDVIGFTVPSEGVWSVDEENGRVSFEPDASLAGDPTPVGYTVRETNGADVSNEAVLSVSYVAPDDPVTQYIGDTFWIDSNGNGVMDSGETPIAGATVELLDANGNAMQCSLSSTMHHKLTTGSVPRRCIVTTNADGKYGFDVIPGSYQVRFVLTQELIDDQYVFDAPRRGSATIDDNMMTFAVDVAAGEQNLDIDAAVSCGCAGITGDSADTMNIWTLLFMVFGLAGMQLFFRKEEEYA
jgi:hypothetical protein